MDTNKKTKSNNAPLVLALIIIPVIFVFGTMMVIAIIISNNRPVIKLNLSEPSDITPYSANLSVNIEGDKDKIQKKGFVYGTSTNPEIKTQSRVSNPIYDLFNNYNYSTFTGTYVELYDNDTIKTVGNLLPETKYYVRAYAITGAGITYSNEISFTTTKKTSSISDDLRRRDVNFILDGVIKLKNQRPNIFYSQNSLPKNIRISGIGYCNSSIVKDSDSFIYSELLRIGYTIPTDPNVKSNGCSDYSISIASNGIITIIAPNAENGPIEVSSN